MATVNVTKLPEQTESSRWCQFARKYANSKGTHSKISTWCSLRTNKTRWKTGAQSAEISQRIFYQANSFFILFFLTGFGRKSCPSKVRSNAIDIGGNYLFRPRHCNLLMFVWNWVPETVSVIRILPPARSVVHTEILGPRNGQALHDFCKNLNSPATFSRQTTQNYEAQKLLEQMAKWRNKKTKFTWI